MYVERKNISKSYRIINKLKFVSSFLSCFLMNTFPYGNHFVPDLGIKQIMG